MLTSDEVAALLRAAEYFRSRPHARIGRDRERDRQRNAERMRRRRRAKT